MRTIQLQNVKESVNAGGELRSIDVSTAELIRLTLNNTPQGGFDVTDMMNRLKIMGELEKARDKEELVLEDADYNNLGGYVKQMRWGFLSQTIVNFVNLFN